MYRQRFYAIFKCASRWSYAYYSGKLVIFMIHTRKVCHFNVTTCSYPLDSRFYLPVIIGKD